MTIEHAAAAGRCRYCGEDLTVDYDQHGNPWYQDADGAVVCPVASVTVYLGHEPWPTTALFEQPQVVP